MLALFIARQGKRHHTRFYPVEEANADHNGNPRPGTVVDRGVTSIYHFDFFLQGEYQTLNRHIISAQYRLYSTWRTSRNDKAHTLLRRS
jgi:Piwi domain